MTPEVKRMIRNFAFELVIYAILVVLYFLVVLRFLGEPLTRLFDDDLTVYAVVSLILIVTQSVVLEQVTTFLVDRLGIERLE